MRLILLSLYTQVNPVMVQDTAPSSSCSVLIQWLRSKAESTSGYDKFVKTRGRPKLPNSQIIRSWQFAAAFSHQYFKKTHDFDCIVS